MIGFVIIQLKSKRKMSTGEDIKKKRKDYRGRLIFAGINE